MKVTSTCEYYEGYTVVKLQRKQRCIIEIMMFRNIEYLTYFIEFCHIKDLHRNLGKQVSKINPVKFWQACYVCVERNGYTVSNEGFVMTCK